MRPLSRLCRAASHTLSRHSSAVAAAAGRKVCSSRIAVVVCALGLTAALINWPIQEKPIPRLATPRPIDAALTR